MEANFDITPYINHVSGCWTFAMQCMDHLTYWLLNDGSVFSAFAIFLIVSSTTIALAARSSKPIPEDRVGYTVESFVHEMTVAGYDAQVSRAAYEYLENEHDPDMPIRPKDDLYLTLGVTEMAVHQAMSSLMKSTARAEHNPEDRLVRQIMTVEDLVGAVQAVPYAHDDHVWELQTA